MSHWGGSAGGWSNTGHPGMQRPGALKRSVDGWDDEELGRLYDHKVVRRLFPYLRPYKRQTVLAFASWLAQYIQQVATAYMGHRMLLTLRTQMFDHIQKLSLSFLDRNEVG